MEISVVNPQSATRSLRNIRLLYVQYKRDWRNRPWLLAGRGFTAKCSEGREGSRIKEEKVHGEFCWFTRWQSWHVPSMAEIAQNQILLDFMSSQHKRSYDTREFSSFEDIVASCQKHQRVTFLLSEFLIFFMCLFSVSEKWFSPS